MSFCGSRQGSLSVKEGVLKNQCFVDVLRIFPHGIFIILSLIILIAWWQSAIGKLKAKTWVHFYCHNVRWLLTLVLILFNCVEIVEGLVSDTIDPDTANYHVIVPPFIALISSILSIIFYHNIEMWNSPQFLLIMIPYWGCSLGLKILKAFSLYANEITSDHVRLWITWIVVILYTLLLIIEFIELFKQRYAFFKKPRKVHPPPELENTRYYATFCNFLSRITFWWMNSLLIEGYRHPLASENLGALPKTERALFNYRKLSDSFNIEKKKTAAKDKELSFHKVYLRSFWPPLLLAALFRFLGDMLAFVGPWCIENIINFAYAELAMPDNSTLVGRKVVVPMSYVPTAYANTTLNNTQDVMTVYYVTITTFCTNGYFLCTLLFVSSLIQHTLLQYHHYLVILQGVRLRSSVQAMVYMKALRLSSLTITNGQMTLGQIINHMTMDSNFLMRLFFFIHYLWATPLQIVVALTLMYMKLGVSAVAGGLLIVISAPIQVFVGRGMSNMQKKVMAEADKRVKRCNEAIHGIKVVKLLAWEIYMTRTINEARARELKCLFINAIYRTLFTFISTAVPALATLVTFILYPYIENEPLTAGKTLSTLALFNILAIPMVLFTLFTSSLIMANVSAKRLVPYFLAPEVEDQHDITDTMQMRHESIGHEVDTEHIPLNPLLSARDKHDHTSASICSLVSHHSHSPIHHARHSSSASLLDFNTDHPTNHAAALTVNNDHHMYRRQPYSGVSIEEEEEQYMVEIQDGSFSWDLNTREPTLRNINIHIPTGRLVIIVGPVGSGKSSLLQALLGEMLTVHGQVVWSKNSDTAYVSQKPWLMNKTLRDNILFGSQFKWKRYQKVIEACALQPDIDMLPAGDQTEIGEKGVNLSGGQKQRVSIARALYSSADTYILDDPMSALDSHVGKHVFEEVILKKLLLRKKTVILVTHQLQYLNSAHLIVVMKEGAVEYQGKLSEVKKTHSELYESWRKALKDAKLAESSRRDSDSHSQEGVVNYTRQHSIQSQVSVDESRTRDNHAKLSTVSAPAGTLEASQHTVGNGKVEEEDVEVVIKGRDKKRSSASGTLIKKEHRETGTIGYRVYMMHLSACGWPLVILVFLLLLVNQSLLVSTNCWIAIWTSESTKFVTAQQHLAVAAAAANTGNNTIQLPEKFDNSEYIHVYLGLSLSAVFVTLCSGFALQFTGVRGSKNLHTNMLNTVLKAPLRFFDTNPTGRIINRFSSDIGSIDQKIPGTWDGFLRCALATFAAVIVNCIGTPYFLLAVIPLCVLYVCMQRFYTATARELQRLDSITTSPIFSHFSETLNGLQIIRAYKAQGRFKQKALATIDTNIAPMVFSQAANRWLGIRLDCMGAVLVFTAGLASLSAGLAGNTDPAFIGLCIAYALMVSNYLNWIVRNSSDLEMMMNAVERVDEYTKLQTETTHSVINPAPGWPSKGQIEFRNVTLRYDESLEAVVHNFTFTIVAGELIGVCGRTGSGKSSLMLSLFRMIELVEGEILIDGLDISRLPLEELRSKLAIIPQDPILFTGTVRYNLDPSGQIEENKLWTALETVQLKDTIEALPEKLDAPISDGGENFSVGQKQLFCLARAFLRDNHILVLDEATASIDMETDNKLQQVITTVFKGRTVITIAHRLSTIMKYHRVMTLSEGQLVEFGVPQDLIKQEDSLFAQLVKQSHK